MKMKKFTVRRSKWARGSEGGDAKLLNAQGNMCCLGFASCQISRIPKKKLLHACTPEEVFRGGSFLTDIQRDDGEVSICDNTLTNAAIEINDSLTLTDEDREKQLKALFRKHGVIVKFVN
jgi:hypothetical protein